MDLEGVGAISAATVAALGIPTAILVGRWQMRGALQQALETSRAGLAQAEASYRGALDAVHAESNAAFQQWRRGVQREAYSALLLAGHEVEIAVRSSITALRKEVLSETYDQHQEDISRALAALQSAYFAVELEGPSDVAVCAADFAASVNKLADFYRWDCDFRRADAQLNRSKQAAIEAFTPDSARPDLTADNLPIVLASTAFSTACSAARDNPDDLLTDPSGNPAPRRGSELEGAVVNFLFHLNDVPGDDPVHSHSIMLEEVALTSSRFRRLGTPGDTGHDRARRSIESDFDTERRRFISEARTELNGPFLRNR
ncbi:hypothetical protein [Streptomyces sp. NPDC005141]